MLLVVVLATSLCPALALGFPEVEQNSSSPLLGFPGVEENSSSQLQETGRRSRSILHAIDGKPAYHGQFRHHAYIDLEDRWMCSGSLIKPSAILTKGACVDGFKKFTIRLGTIMREGDDSAVTVESAWGLVHPEYNMGKYLTNDVAVILLNVEVPLGYSIWPVKLPSFDDVNDTFTGRHALITGWGKLNDTRTYQDKLLYSEVTVISNDVCKRYFKRGYIIDSTICAGDAYCLGDHGGALVIKTGGHYTQIGIASFLVKKCEIAAPGAYARVTSFLEWIQRAAGRLDDWGATEVSDDHWGHAEDSDLN